MKKILSAFCLPLLTFFWCINIIDTPKGLWFSPFFYIWPIAVVITVLGWLSPNKPERDNSHMLLSWLALSLSWLIPVAGLLYTFTVVPINLSSSDRWLLCGVSILVVFSVNVILWLQPSRPNNQ